MKNADVYLNNNQPLDETKNNNNEINNSINDNTPIHKKSSSNTKNKVKFNLLNRKKSIHIRTIDAGQNNSVIEQKLPNPFNITERSKRYKIIEYNIKSNYKSLYADYINHTADINKKKIKINNTIRELSSKVEPYIYFTKTSHNKSADARIKSRDK